MVAVGSRGRVVGGVVYPVSEVAARYDASVERETTNPAEAYEKVGQICHGRPSSCYSSDGSPD